MLYKTFVDDTGTKKYVGRYNRDYVDTPPPFDGNHKYWLDNYFVLTGVRVKQCDLKKIDISIRNLKHEYFGTDQVEVKSYWLRNPKERKRRYEDLYQIDTMKLSEFGEKFIDLIASYSNEMKIISIVIDKRYYAKRQDPQYYPLLIATQCLLERVHRAGDSNAIVFDQMESSTNVNIGDHGKMLRVYKSNEFVKKIYIPEYKNIESIKFERSCDENFLQVADVCSYNIYRQFVEHGREWLGIGCKSSEDGGKLMGSYGYFDRIIKNFYYSPYPNYRATKYKQVRGYGLTLIPDIAKLDWNFLKDAS